MRKLYTVVGLGLAALLVAAAPATADGTETLGTPSVSLASGTGVAVGGAGTQAFPNVDRSLSVTVPAGATVKQVLLYWEGHWTDHVPHWSHVPQVDGDNVVSLNGNVVTGTKIGGSTPFYIQSTGAVDGTENHVAYRADVTALNLVSAGMTNLTLGNMRFESNFLLGFPFDQGNDGAAVVVVYDGGGTAATIGLKDGLDLAFANFPSPLDTTVPQTFTFPSAAVDRAGSLSTLAGSVGLPGGPQGVRGNVLQLAFNTGQTASFVDPWASSQGAEFDALTLPVTIPAGATSMTVQALSQGGDLPASFAWIGATLTVPTLTPPPAALGDFVWHDLNKNGIQDAGEPGIAGVTVKLFDCASNQLATTTTSASGLYLFNNLTAGGYSVQFVLPSGYAFTLLNQGANDATDSDANTTTGRTGCYTLAAGETNLTVDAGMFQPPRFAGETATGAGFSWSWTQGAPSTWFMYTPWVTTTVNGVTKTGISPNGVDLIAGQHYIAGRITGTRNGTTTITITLNAGFRFADASGNVKINPMSCTSSQPYKSPGKFTVQRTASVAANSITVTGLANAACYGIHADVERELP